MKAFSKPWLETLVEKLKNNASFQEKAKGFDSMFQFSVTDDPKLSCGVNLPQADVSWEGEKPEEELDIILQGKFNDFMAVLKGKAQLLPYVTSGKLRLKKGDVGKLLSYLGGVNEFINVAKTITT